MKQVLTLVVKLQVDANQQQLLIDTANAFASACNWINQNVNPNLTNRNSIQAVCYKDVKDRFGLTANHVIRACARVAANRLTARQKAVRGERGFMTKQLNVVDHKSNYLKPLFHPRVGDRRKGGKGTSRASVVHRGVTTDKQKSPLPARTKTISSAIGYFSM